MTLRPQPSVIPFDWQERESACVGVIAAPIRAVMDEAIAAGWSKDLVTGALVEIAEEKSGEKFPARLNKRTVLSIDGPPAVSPGTWMERELQCIDAIADPVLAIVEETASAGWPRAVVTAALLELALYEFESHLAVQRYIATDSRLTAP